MRLIEATDPEDGLKECIKGDAWFGYIRACSALGGEVHKDFHQIKENKDLYPKAFIEEQMAANPGGTSIVLKGKHPNGVPFIAIGYRYSTLTTLFVLMMEDVSECMIGKCCLSVSLYFFISPIWFIVVYPTTGTMRHGKPYEMKWTYSHKKIHIHHVDRPDAISKFFEKLNTINSHNQLHRGQLNLDKCWVTQDCWFRLHTTIIGIDTTYTFHMAVHHKLIPKGYYPITYFSGVLSQQQITHVKSI
jgi:hypothetical protein